MKKIIATLLLVALLSFTTHSNASLVTSLPEGSVISMPSSPVWGSTQLASGINWYSTYSGSVIGYSGLYGFANNGSWYGLPMAGLISSTGTMTFAFDTPVAAVGGLLNYSIPIYGSPSIAVYDSSYNLIESAALSFYTGGGSNNPGFFYGFRETNPIISYFTLSNSYIGIANLTVASTSSPVPIPAAIWLFGSGLLGLIGLSRKFKK